MAGIEEGKLRDDCKIAFEKVFDIIEKIQLDFVYGEIHPEITYAEWRVLRNDPCRAKEHISRAVISWEEILRARGEKDKTGLATVLLVAQQAVTQWVAFCNRQMKEKKNG